MNNRPIDKLTKDPYRLAGIVQVLLKFNNERDEPKKYIWVASMSSINTILNIELIEESDKETVKLNLKECFKNPLKLDAKGIIFITNHLDETTLPDEQDKEIIKKLLEVTNLLDLPLLDYLIINQENYYSFKSAREMLGFTELV